MLRKLWATSLLLAACHAGYLRWKRVRGRRRQTASSQEDILRLAASLRTLGISWKTFAPAKGSGTPSTPTTNPPSSSTPSHGRQPVHIPEQRTRLTHIPWDSTSPGLYELRVREAPEGGNIVGPEDQSHED